MIDFRYHVISIVAVFLALATGLVLGASLLNTQIIETQNSQNESLIEDKNALREELSALEDQRDSLEQFISAAGPLAVRDLLAEQRVVIVTLPAAGEGDGQDVLDGVTADLLDAGVAEVVGTVAITDLWTDEGEVDVLDGLVAQLTRANIELPEGRAYDRAAVLLASALVGPQPVPEPPSDPSPTATDPDESESPDPDGSESPDPDPTTEPPDGLSEDDISTILEGLSAGGFITFGGSPTAVADLAVIVAPPAPETTDDRTEIVNGAWIRLATALDEIGLASVLTGPAAAAETGGVIAALRADDAASGLVSTVDSAETGPGQVATVVALAAELNGQTGHYGQVGDVDGPIPVF